MTRPWLEGGALRVVRVGAPEMAAAIFATLRGTVRRYDDGRSGVVFHEVAAAELLGGVAAAVAAALELPAGLNRLELLVRTAERLADRPTVLLLPPPLEPRPQLGDEAAQWVDRLEKIDPRVRVLMILLDTPEQRVVGEVFDLSLGLPAERLLTGPDVPDDEVWRRLPAPAVGLGSGRRRRPSGGGRRRRGRPRLRRRGLLRGAHESGRPTSLRQPGARDGDRGPGIRRAPPAPDAVRRVGWPSGRRNLEASGGGPSPLAARPARIRPFRCPGWPAVCCWPDWCRWRPTICGPASSVGRWWPTRCSTACLPTSEAAGTSGRWARKQGRQPPDVASSRHQVTFLEPGSYAAALYPPGCPALPDDPWPFAHLRRVPECHGSRRSAAGA